MAFREKTKQKYLDELDELIDLGRSIVENSPQPSISFVTSSSVPDNTPSYNYQPYLNWCRRTEVIIKHLFSRPEDHKKWIDTVNSSDDYVRYHAQKVLAILEAMRGSLEKGLLDPIADIVEAEISADYMTQAELLLDDCKEADYSYIPAAVLAGAVLERHLRRLCEKQDPVISTLKANGKKKTLDPLIADLKKAGVFNANTAKQLVGFAGIRNSAAHGEWAQITREQIKAMVSGVNDFLVKTS